jgi:hypothetical protein
MVAAKNNPKAELPLAISIRVHFWGLKDRKFSGSPFPSSICRKQDFFALGFSFIKAIYNLTFCVVWCVGVEKKSMCLHIEVGNNFIIRNSKNDC